MEGTGNEGVEEKYDKEKVGERNDCEVLEVDTLKKTQVLIRQLLRVKMRVKGIVISDQERNERSNHVGSISTSRTITSCCCIHLPDDAPVMMATLFSRRPGIVTLEIFMREEGRTGRTRQDSCFRDFYTPRRDELT